MRAWTITKYSDALALREVPEPSVGHEDVLIRVASVGLNHLDEKLRVGEFRLVLPIAFPHTLGQDVAGIVERVGSSVRDIAVGDRVIALQDTVRSGSLAEYVVVNRRNVAHAPRTISLESAGAVPLVALTAWQALVVLGNVQPGQRVLIHGGSGGVGSIAIQLAKSLGAFVATTVGPSNVEYAREKGADLVVNYAHQDFHAELRDFDFVLDGMGASNVLKSIDIVRPGGMVVGIAGPPDPAFAASVTRNPIARLAIALLSRVVRSRAARRGVTYRFLFVQPDGRQLQDIVSRIDEGIVSVDIGAQFDFAQADKALASFIDGDVRRGKVVVTLGRHNA